MMREGLTQELVAAQIQQLDEIVACVNDAVWASFVPQFAVGESAVLERKVEDSFALYLNLIDRSIKPRSKRIPRITWRHWYSGKREEYGYLHFHILYLLDGTGISTEEMTELHRRVLGEIEKLDSKAQLEHISVKLKEKELAAWAAKAGRKYKPQRIPQFKRVLNKEASTAVVTDNNGKCVGYGSKLKKLKRRSDAEVFEIYSTSQHHTVINN